MDPNVRAFVDAFTQSDVDGSFIKLSLGHYRGSDEGLQKIRVRQIESKKGPVFSAVFRYEKNDITKNYSTAEMSKLLEEVLGGEFRSGNLFTSAGDLQFEANKKGNSRIVRSRPTATTPPARTHDHPKSHLVDPTAPYLYELGITTAEGKVRDKQQGKWRQINKFVEIVSNLLDNSELKDRRSLNVVDMGSGKGYLTFAIYDYLRNRRSVDASVTGVEVRKQLVETCNRAASEKGYFGLRFMQGSIADLELKDTDVLIALHACDTATDDALFKGIRARASILIVAPCCHQELRPQLAGPPDLSGLLRHGVMAETMAEMLTDSLRALLLERHGYISKVFDFVPVEHTPKNKLIVGMRRKGPTQRAAREFNALKKAFGIERQRLEELLEQSDGGQAPGTSRG